MGVCASGKPLSALRSHRGSAGGSSMPTNSTHRRTSSRCLAACLSAMTTACPGWQKSHANSPRSVTRSRHAVRCGGSIGGLSPTRPRAPSLCISEGYRRQGPGRLLCASRRARGVAAGKDAGKIDHFMPLSLLDSQLATLEPLGPGESGLTVDAASEPDDLIAELAERLTD
jgi:hypothetical protein